MREPLGLIGSVFVPVIVFVIIGRTFGGRLTGADQGQRGLVGVDLAVFAALLICDQCRPVARHDLAIYREGGILKRLRATPLRPLTILTAHVLVKLLFTAATVTLMTLPGRRYLPADIPIPWVAFTAATLVSTLSILSLGFVLASLAPTARFAQPIGTIVLYPMIGVSGLFMPIADMPACCSSRPPHAGELRRVADARRLARRLLAAARRRPRRTGHHLRALLGARRESLSLGMNIRTP